MIAFTFIPPVQDLIASLVLGEPLGEIVEQSACRLADEYELGEGNRLDAFTLDEIAAAAIAVSIIGHCDDNPDEYYTEAWQKWMSAQPRQSLASLLWDVIDKPVPTTLVMSLRDGMKRFDKQRKTIEAA